MTVEYRILEPSMLTALADVINASGRDQPLFSPVLAEQLRVGLLEDPDYDAEGALMAFEGGRAIGAGIASWSKSQAGPGPRRATLQIAVVPDRRRAGIERELMRLLLARCKEAGLKEAVFSANAGSGWKLDLAREFGFSPTRTSYRMARPISGAPVGDEGTEGIAYELVDMKTAGDGFVEEFVGTMNSSFRGDSSAPPMSAKEAASMREIRGLEAACVMAREAGGSPVGACLALFERRANARVGELNIVGVLPEFRRRGIAKGLMLRAIGWLADNGMVEAALSMEAQNSRALNLYEQLGFRVRSESIGFKLRL